MCVVRFILFLWKFVNKIILIRIVFFFLLLNFGLFAQRNNPPKKNGSQKKVFEYELIGDFSSEPYFTADINFLRSMIYGNYANFGAGAGIGMYNIGKKLSLEGDFAYNYFTYTYKGTNFIFGIEDYNKKSSLEFGGTIGYNLFQTKKEIKECYTPLKNEGNVILHTMLPAIESITYSAHIGFKSIGMFNESAPSFTASFYDSQIDSTYVYYAENTVTNFFQNNSIYLGLKRTSIIDTRYLTKDYGEVGSDYVTEIYGGILLGFKPTFPRIYQYIKDEVYTTEINSTEQISTNGQIELESSYNFLPVGLKVGYVKSNKISGLGFNCEFAMYPGYNSKTLQQASIRAGVFYRLVKKVK